jgi:ABC-2 type transport system ATP-binding protein
MILIDKLSFSYSKKKTLFTDLDLQLKKGRVYGLLGKNGVGKSTLLKLLIGTLKAQSGTVTVDGLLSSDRNAHILENCYLLQTDLYQPAISIEQYVGIYSGFYPKFGMEKFINIMQSFSVPYSATLKELSVGQRKKFVLSFALATNVDYLFLDEPAASLDIPSRGQLRKILAAGHHDAQCLIISTHQLVDFNRLLDDVIILDKGKILFHQQIAEIEERLQFVSPSEVMDAEQLLYGNIHHGEALNIYSNKSGRPSSIDIELLFNAVIADHQLIQDQF